MTGVQRQAAADLVPELLKEFLILRSFTRPPKPFLENNLLGLGKDSCSTSKNLQLFVIRADTRLQTCHARSQALPTECKRPPSS